MTEKRKSKWYYRLIRWAMVFVAGIITLGAVIITEENVRGRRAWEAYKQEAAAKGDPVDGIPTSTNVIPDELNFAKSSLFAGVASRKGIPAASTNDPAAIRMHTLRNDIQGDGETPRTGDWSQSRLTNLKDWQTYYRAPSSNGPPEFPVAATPQTPAADVLLALSKYDSLIEEWRKASLRPYSRFAQYDANDPATLANLLEYLAEFKSSCSVIQLRAIAELGGKDAGKAFEDTKLLLRLNDTLRQEPVLIAQLLSLASMNIASQAIYEGLAQHQWSEAQLAELEQALSSKDFLADYRLAMRGERAFAMNGFENMRLSGEYKSVDEAGGTNRVKTASLRLVPNAFFFQNELAFARMHDQFLVPFVDLQNRIVSPASARRVESQVREASKHYNPYKIMASMTFPAIGKSVSKFAAAQSQTDLARVACALERYRLAHGGYPESLDKVTPQFIEKLPHDIINGKPLNYRLTDNGAFILYSVGWNEKDDNGQPGVTKKGNTDREKGDWVWQYPAK